MTSVENLEIIPYSQHYRSAQEFIGGPADQVVFQYIWDEWLCRYRQGRETAFEISMQRISLNRQINRRTVKESLERLTAKNLISFEADGKCSLNAGRFFSMVVAFESLGRDDRNRFVKAVNDLDNETLEELGCNLSLDVDEFVSEISGGVCNFTQGCAKMHTTDSEGVQKCTHQEPDMCKNTQGCVKMHTPNDVGVCKNAQGGVQKCTGVCKNAHPLTDDLVKIMTENHTPEELCDMLYPAFEAEESYNSLLDKIIDLISSEGVCKNAHMDILVALAILGCVKMHTPLCKNAHISQKTCAFLHTRNKYRINLNKEAGDFHVAGKLNEQEMEDERVNDEELPDLSTETESNDCEPVDPSFDTRPFQLLHDRYEKIKLRDKLPFIPEKEVREAISNLPVFLDRPEMIFINQLWEILVELFMGEIPDDDGNMVDVVQDPEGMHFPADRMMNDLLMPAYESTRTILENGCYSYKGDKLPVSQEKEFKPEDVEMLIDWELGSDRQGKFYVISKARFKNIYSQPIEERRRICGRREGHVDRERDWDYMRQIVRMGDSEQDYEKLTDIEYAAYNFIVTFYNIDEDLHRFSPINPRAYYHQLKLFYNQLPKTVTQKDFLKTLFMNEPNKEDGYLTLKPRVFSAQALIEWNQKHAQISSIVPLDE